MRVLLFLIMLLGGFTPPVHAASTTTPELTTTPSFLCGTTCPTIHNDGAPVPPTFSGSEPGIFSLIDVGNATCHANDLQCIGGSQYSGLFVTVEDGEVVIFCDF